MRKQNRFELKMKTDNAAFTESGAGEVARILREAADKLEKDWGSGNCVDYNGNTVGEWFLEFEND